jgi:hypothetical protein
LETKAGVQALVCKGVGQGPPRQLRRKRRSADSGAKVDKFFDVAVKKATSIADQAILFAAYKKAADTQMICEI